MRFVALSFCLLIPALAAAKTRPIEPSRKTEEIGSWIVRCASVGKDEGMACGMRHRVWVLAPAGGRPFAALEVQARRGALVPVLAIHGVTIPDATGAVLALAASASLQFDTNPPIPLPCGFEMDTILCAPTRADAPAGLEQLRNARTALLRVHLAEPAKLAGLLPEQTRSLELARTADAIRLIQPTSTAADTRWDLRDVVDWLAQQAGFPGGANALLRWLFGQAAMLPKQ